MNTIKSQRIASNLTQIELAKAVGVTQGAVAQWEKGLTSPNVKLLPAIALILNCTTDELLGVAKKPAEEQA